MTVAFSHSPTAMTSDKMQRTYLVVRCIVEFLLLNRRQAARYASVGACFTGWSGRTDGGRNVVWQTVHQGCGGKGNSEGTPEAVVDKPVPGKSPGWTGFETF